MRLLTTLSIFSILFSISLSAAYLPLKGKNGRVAEFQVESVEAEGLMVVRKGDYRKIQVGWEHLDLAWLKANHPKLWEEKEAIERTQGLAFQDYYFGASQAEISHQIQVRGGFRIPSAVFGDTDTSVIWACFDAEALRQFFRFRFDEDDQLKELEVHHNFDSTDESEAAMMKEWERVKETVSGYRSELVQRESYRRLSDWKRLVSKVRSDEGEKHVTHRWEDDERKFELGLLWREVEFGPRRASASKVTFFGKEIKNHGSAFLLPNWVVLKAVLK